MPPKTPVNNPPTFSFLDYRSPDRNSDSSGSPTPRQLPVKANIISNAPLHPPTMPQSKGQSGDGSNSRNAIREDKGMRFSFILTADGSSACSKRLNRPSLITMDEKPAGFVSPVRSIDTQESNDDTLSTFTTSSVFDTISGLTQLCTELEACETQRSSWADKRESIYFDAVEEQNGQDEQERPVSEVLDAIPEYDKMEELALEAEGQEEKEDRSFSSLVEYPSWSQHEEDEEDDDTFADTYQDGKEYEDGEEDRNTQDVEEGDLVLADLLSHFLFHLPCTHATASSIMRLKRSGLSLLSYSESEDIYASLINRIQRMVSYESRLASRNQRSPSPLSQLVRRLRKWLEEIKGGRIMTGESPGLAMHEIEWVGWIEDAARTGVLHVRREGMECQCRREWKKHWAVSSNPSLGNE